MPLRTLHVSSQNIDRFYCDGYLEYDGPEDTPDQNEPLILQAHSSQSGLGIYQGNTIHRIQERVCCNLKPRNAEQLASSYVLTDESIPLVTLVGRAGSGKTLLAVAAGLHSVHSKHYTKLLVARPFVGLEDRDDLGYMPGDFGEKMDPWLQPIYDNLRVLGYETAAIKKLVGECRLEVCSLQHIRGRSLSGVYVVVDEAQNLSPKAVKTIVTRIGEKTKMVLTGDTDQIDRNALTGGRDGLTYLINRTKNERMIGHVKLRKSERSPIVDRLSELLNDSQSI